MILYFDELKVFKRIQKKWYNLSFSFIITVLWFVKKLDEIFVGNL